MKPSDLPFHETAILRRRKAWFHIRLSRMLFAAKSLDDSEYEQTIICRQLFATARSLPPSFVIIVIFFLYREKNMYTRGAEVKKLIDRAGNKLE